MKECWKGWMEVMREKLMRFMYGRYGVDKLSRHLVIAGLVLSFVSILFGGNILYLLSLAMFIYGYYRVFSRNHAKRYQELAAYERFLAKIKKYPEKWKREMAQRKDYRIFKCPTCKQKIRIPKGRGNVEIRCPKCRTAFRKRT